MTSKAGKSQRITFKRKHPNPLFQEWLEELHEDAKTKKSKLEPMLREALSSITKYPLPLKSGAECAILKGFEKKLCLFIDKRLEFYRTNKNYSEQQTTTSKSTTPVESQVPPSHNEESLRSRQLRSGTVQRIQNNSPGPDDNQQAVHNDNLPSVSSNQPKTKSRDRIYKPAYRSGGYAILIALLKHTHEDCHKVALSKDELIEKAQIYSEESFVRPKAESFYTAWSNMTRLVTKGLVQKTRSKKVEYSLTDQGVLIAKELLKESDNRPTTNDIIFNNVAVNHNGSQSTVNGSQSTVNGSQSTVNGSTGSSTSISQVTETQSSCKDVEVIEFSAGSFDIILLIDKNETRGVSKKTDPTVAQFKKYPNLKHEYRSLKVGDFTWIAKHKVNTAQELVLPYIVERKRMDDLGASIKDGRFHEQKFRLRKCGLDNVIYLVENYGSNKNVGLPVQSLMQALANTREQDGFKVHITDSLTDSALFLAMMTKRLTVEYQDKNLQGYAKEPCYDDLMTFQYFNKAASKSKPLTVTETFIKLLLQLKGLSVEKALTITNVYKTPAMLIEAYKGRNQKEAEMLLANLKYGNTSRNVGPVTSKSIHHVFNMNSITIQNVIRQWTDP